MQDHLRQVAGGQRSLAGLFHGYSACAGRGPGIAPAEDPYELTGSVRLDVPDDRRPGIVRKLRDALGAEGFRIGEDPESAAGDPSAPPTDAFQAVHEGEQVEDCYTVDVRSAKPGLGVALAVTLPCLEPPAGATSAP
ncbi:hypothetical protein [Kitasatospora camelliae]|uniref:Uncharacterized protein n=1 Tax=Kitasatospora camelliae TaxID=3156397 RepID=A0AAU8JQF4_9ACTN